VGMGIRRCRRPGRMTTPKIEARDSPIVVLDTNIALDWLVFEDGGMPELMHAINARHITIVTNEACIAELARVLAYPTFALDVAAQTQALETYRRYSKTVAPRASLLGRVPRCRDKDDQKFFELAAHASAEALISKDAAVLGLRSSMKTRFRCDVLAPKHTAAWLAARLGNVAANR
jgi:uncharacterized protein